MLDLIGENRFLVMVIFSFSATVEWCDATRKIEGKGFTQFIPVLSWSRKLFWRYLWLTWEGSQFDHRHSLSCKLSAMNLDWYLGYWFHVWYLEGKCSSCEFLVCRRIFQAGERRIWMGKKTKSDMLGICIQPNCSYRSNVRTSSSATLFRREIFIGICAVPC